MPSATLTITLFPSEEEVTETFSDPDPQGAFLLARARAQQLQAAGYERENADGSQDLYSVSTKVEEGS